MMATPLIRVTPDRRLADTAEQHDAACAEMSAAGRRCIGVETTGSHAWAVFVPLAATLADDRRYYVEGRPFTIDEVIWVGRDEACVSWSYDDRDEVLLTAVTVETDADVFYDPAAYPDDPEPACYVLDAIFERVRDAYPDHLHEWSY